MYGYTGKMAILDLSRGSVDIASSETYNRDYIGGRGVGSRILFDESDPSADALSEDNPLIFGTGPLSATAAPTSGRLSLVTKNAVSGGFAFSNAGGHLGPELKYAGFDHLLIRGKAPSPVYAAIDNGKIEIRDARHLWGRTVWETEEYLEKELGGGIQVMSIGPAGENLVKSACIMVNSGRAFGFGGCGAVMGSKHLKAVAIRGEQTVRVLDPQGFIEECDRLNQRMSLSVGGNILRQGGTINKIGPSFPLPARNSTPPDVPGAGPARSPAPFITIAASTPCRPV
jgi:aldehyde:ferredoxin oxidoreductase